ncbi:hypothetical protein A6J66_017940 [Yersinia enterocolitica]|nr:hypothetical protein A6J66_017940 [Yersinia enterocolitica]
MASRACREGLVLEILIKVEGGEYRKPPMGLFAIIIQASSVAVLAVIEVAITVHVIAAILQVPLIWHKGQSYK